MSNKGYGSEFDDGSSRDGGRKRKRMDDISYYNNKGRSNLHSSGLPSKTQLTDEYSREQGKLAFAKFKCLNAYERHQKLINDYVRYYGGEIAAKKETKTFKTDLDVIAENHKFVWDEDDDEDDDSEGKDKTWGQRLAKKYYDKLFKEYCISDVSRYKHNQFAMRWRTEGEVKSGKGQFSCGARRCEEGEGLKTWEVNFAYVENDGKKNCLIKLRLCPDCSYKLNYHRKHKQIKKKKKEKKKKKKRKKKKHKSDSDSSSDDEAEKSDEKKGECSTTSATDDTSESCIWTQPTEEPSEKTKDDLFDEYLEDLFM